MKFPRHLPEMAEPPAITQDYKIFVKQEPTVPKSLPSTLCHRDSKSNEAVMSVPCVKSQSLGRHTHTHTHAAVQRCLAQRA